jgi:hypothetical protein
MTELVTLGMNSITQYLKFKENVLQFKHGLAYILCCKNGSGDPEELQECGGGGDGQTQHQHQKSTTAIVPLAAPVLESTGTIAHS